MQDCLQAIVFFITKKSETKERAIMKSAAKGRLNATGRTWTVSSKAQILRHCSMNCRESSQ